MQTTTFMNMTARVEALLQAKIGVRGPDLATKLRRAGRRLPRRVRRAGLALAETEARCRHPKHAHEIDDSAVSAAYDTMVDFLDGYDPAAARNRRIIGVLSAMAVNLVLVAGALLVWAVWRGLI